MPYLIAIAKFPSHTGNAVGKTYIEMLKKYPPDNSLGEDLIPAAVKRTSKGVTSITITEVKKGKLEEAFKRSMDQLAMFNDIQGYEVSLEVWSTVGEALATIGMKMP
ncbi:MAG: hypothetical protein EU535_02165 [Promethearchaeota archaeon]|nr:MAG: hypothetical protein EU535_02165 [Candidatus Lokiarchaeota archaeon]